MASKFVLRRLNTETRPVLERLWRLYRHDLSEFRGSLPDGDGTFHTRSLVPLFTDDPSRSAYLFYLATNPVGFAFIGSVTSEPRLMSEFFIVRGVRRHSIGRAGVDQLFGLYPGKWEIPFQEQNVAAARFWRGVAAMVAGENFREERRPVPGKPQLPHDVWITITVG